MLTERNPLSVKSWKARIDACKGDRRELVQAWSENVDFRRGKPFNVESDIDRVNVNIDWSLTKAKHAQLFSQIPTVIAYPAQAQPLLNKELRKANAGAAVDEAVIDCINASGIGAVMVRYERKTEEIDIPAVDKLTAQMLVQAGQEVPTTKAPRTTSDRFVIERLSPSDLLWPVEFTGSDFDQAPWIGRSGRMYWGEAVATFNLTEEDYDRISAASRERGETLRESGDHDADVVAMVAFDEIFYRQTTFDPKAKYYDAIQRLVFIDGIERAVVDEPWNGQQFDEQTGEYFGSCKFPIRVLTLSYVSDDAIPPSDTAIGRPQVLELIRSRSQMILQRERSLPQRWHDVNRIDPAIASNLMRGTWQNSVPVQGNGDQAMGEVARASYPREDFEFDRVSKQDLSEQWSLGANQLGQFASGERSATEAGVIQRNNDSRIGYERGRVSKFFIGIAEVLGGLMTLYREGFPRLPEDALSVRPDATVLLDAKSRLDQLAYFLNLTAKSGYVNLPPVLQEMAQLVQLDPAVIQAPQPPKPEEPNISFRFSGEDLMNPMVQEILAKAGYLPTPQPPTQPDPSDMGPGLERITKRTEEI